MKVLLDEKGYISSFTIDEDNSFGDFEDVAVILPNPEDIDHFVEHYMHYTKDGFDQAHYDALLAEQEAEASKAVVQAQIDELKAQLAAGDYKVTKCLEAQIAGDEMPYDFAALRAERQAIRKLINELEQ